MILSADRQAEIFMLSFMLGIYCAFFYAVIKAIRLIIPHGKIVSGMEDGVYWAGCGLFVVKYMLEKNNGEIRVFSVIAFFSAMILYNTIFGLFVEKILGKTALAIKKIMLAAAECVAMPFKLVWHICRRPAVKARNKVKKTGYAVLILIKKYVKIKLITFRALLRPGKK